MKTGLAVALAALVLSTGCSGNRTEAPAQPAAAAPSQPAEPPAVAAAAPASTPSQPVTTTTTTAPVATDKSLTVTDVAGHVIETVPPSENPPEAKPPEVKPPEAKPQDPLEWMKQREQDKADYKTKLADAESKVATGNAAIAEWQNTILAFKNPFRPRPQLTAEEAQAIDGKDGVARVSWAEGKLAEATTARDAAQKALDDLKSNPPN